MWVVSTCQLPNFYPCLLLMGVRTWFLSHTPLSFYLPITWWDCLPIKNRSLNTLTWSITSSLQHNQHCPIHCHVYQTNHLHCINRHWSYILGIFDCLLLYQLCFGMHHNELHTKWCLWCWWAWCNITPCLHVNGRSDSITKMILMGHLTKFSMTLKATNVALNSTCIMRRLSKQMQCKRKEN